MISYTIDRILEIVGQGAELVGAYDGDVKRIASLSDAGAGDLSFLGNRKYRSEVANSSASVILLPKNYTGEPKASQLFIRLENPNYALALICRDIENSLYPLPPAGIHPTASVDPAAEVDDSASIGAFCYIAAGARIGAQTVLENHVSIGREAEIGRECYLSAQVSVADRCIIGDRNRLLAGCVIGSDGYGYAPIDGEHQRLPQIGNVLTEADVDIGANSTVDRARFGTTLIQAGTKLDNLVQIAHNVTIGRHCLIVSQSAIAGSSVLGDRVTLAGQSAVIGHLKIADGTIIYAKSLAMRSTEPNAKILGTFGQNANLMNRIYVLQRKLPELFKKFEELEKFVKSQK
ncbi:MAG: UDP-3-O-acylglucosamine N-acyltransferase [Opitutia bacterium UBA7350]|nr:MAG: UDP-3-O-acylglucosamine N-acyltransferase [Opitutae bacterium UBA7350]